MAVEDVNAPVVQERRLRDGSPRGGAANRAAPKRPRANFLNCLETMSFGAFVFVKRHKQYSSYHMKMIVSTDRPFVLFCLSFPGINFYVCFAQSSSAKTQAMVWVFF